MQTPHRFLTTSHRRQRLVLWALAMLTWIAAVLFAGQRITPRQVRQRHKSVSLERLTRLTIQLLLVRSAELARRPRIRIIYYKHGRDRRRRHFIRSLLGAQLRRALTRKDLAARVAQLIHVLRHLDHFARALFRRRLTRLWRVVPQLAPSVALHGAPAPSPAFSDSS
jgi:hypothetical protein